MKTQCGKECRVPRDEVAVNKSMQTKGVGSYILEYPNSLMGSSYMIGHQP